MSGTRQGKYTKSVKPQPISYREDACPMHALPECTISEYYSYLFKDCSDYDKIYRCFMGRLHAYLYRRRFGVRTDAGHDFAIALAGWYLANCLKKYYGDLGMAMDEVEEIYESEHANAGLRVTGRIFENMDRYPNGRISPKCREALQALNLELS